MSLLVAPMWLGCVIGWAWGVAWLWVTGALR